MVAIRFTGNYEDLSTDRGYQFKFFCEKCHNGYMRRAASSAPNAAPPTPRKRNAPRADMKPRGRRSSVRSAGESINTFSREGAKTRRKRIQYLLRVFASSRD